MIDISVCVGGCEELELVCVAVEVESVESVLRVVVLLEGRMSTCLDLTDPF
jgi:hypothetical protein